MLVAPCFALTTRNQTGLHHVLGLRSMSRGTQCCQTLNERADTPFNFTKVPTDILPHETVPHETER
ncbi:hypothetical protein BH23CYA1_BH23CYA1_13890 [soil metagenome]